MKSEFILAYPKQPLLDALRSDPSIQCLNDERCEIFEYRGKETNGFKAFAEVFDGMTRDAYFGRREELEKSLTEIHPIPYIVFERPDHSVYQYQRGKDTEEGRLAGDDSVGVGGHVEQRDAVNGIDFVPYLHAFVADVENWLAFGKDLQAMLTAILREANEEVRLMPVENNSYIDLDTGFGFRFIGAMYDETNDVGVRHLALVFAVKIPANMDVLSKETVIEDRGFSLPEQLVDRNNKGLIKLENWSRVVLELLVRQRARLANNA
jgi:predicted NUDIX family phosphoesterase